jgi:multidrug efflux pump
LQAYVRIDREAAARLGVTVLAIDNALYNAFGQRLVSTIFTQSNQYRVVLEVQDQDRIGPAALSLLQVPSVNGTQVPLEQCGQGGRTLCLAQHLACGAISRRHFVVQASRKGFTG